MNLSANTILITGGATGIGLALAERFLAAGSEVIVCGRREEALAEARSRHPGLHTRVCDVADPDQRADLAAWATSAFPKLNVLINNAGVQQRIDLKTDPSWETLGREIAINLEGPVHLATLFIPHLLEQEQPAIINVTSGLAFVPLANVPVYSATKAALRSFTLSLRHQLDDTPITVIELIPPAVDTDLGGKGLHTFGAPLDTFADAIVEQLAAGSLEPAYGFALQARTASRDDLDVLFQRLNTTR
ncbi:MAG: SDR family NAD(P)-dependent oxidoreductase [Rhodothermales bacterium]